jgi:hypothetical protein
MYKAISANFTSLDSINHNKNPEQKLHLHLNMYRLFTFYLFIDWLIDSTGG